MAGAKYPFGSIEHRLSSAAAHPHMDNTCKVSVFDAYDAIAAIAEMRELLAEADPRIIWEDHGLGRDFADRVEAAIAKARGS
jgi:hypothetical protein